MTTATAILDEMATSFDVHGSAVAGDAVGFGGGLLAKAKAFREVLVALRAGGVDDDSILGKIGEIMKLIIDNLPDILQIIAMVKALFGL